MEYLITGLLLFAIGNLIHLERICAENKKDIKYLMARICRKDKKGGKGHG